MYKEDSAYFPCGSVRQNMRLIFQKRYFFCLPFFSKTTFRKCCEYHPHLQYTGNEFVLAIRHLPSSHSKITLIGLRIMTLGSLEAILLFEYCAFVASHICHVFDVSLWC